ncbi:MAG TPA: hypothetical protein VEA69_06850 [Tepidisphaeraceae bacterium]|nr:hypothetical protein [Tepidisphaeraceae bacterium]
MTHVSPIVAEAGYGQLFIWSVVLVVAVALLFGVLYLYRRWMNNQGTTTGPGFTLSDLRRYHKEGKMTTEEFEKAKALVIGTVKKSAETETPHRDLARDRAAARGGAALGGDGQATAGAGETTPGQGPRNPAGG